MAVVKAASEYIWYVGAYTNFWYINTKFSVILIGGILYRGWKCGNICLDFSNVPSFNPWNIGASYDFGMIIQD